MDLERVYSRLPWCWLQNIAASLEGLRIQHYRYGSPFFQILSACENRSFWSWDQICTYRDERLLRYIQTTMNTVPFYRERFKRAGLQAECIRTPEDLKHLPVLTKREVQEDYPRLLSQTTPQREHFITHTSGTTGGGLRFATTRRAVQEQWATWWRYRRWHEIQMHTWCGYFGGRSVVTLAQSAPPFWRYNFATRQILFSGYHMNCRNLRAYVEELRSRKPPWLHGYPSLLAALASFILETDGDPGYQVRWITSGAENLLPHQRQLILRAFGVKPIQNYGMAEAVANFSECEQGVLHVDEDFAFVEFIPIEGTDSCRLVGTNFTNPATPLIRYDTGDHVTLSKTPCRCGRPGRTVAMVDGRQEDYVILRSGAKIGRMDHVFKDLVNVREAQIHQQKVGEIMVKVVRGKTYCPEDEQLLLQEIYKRVGKDTSVSISYVDEIERTRGGKLRFVVSELEKGQIGSGQ